MEDLYDPFSSEEELRVLVKKAKTMVPTTRVKKVEQEQVADSVSQSTEGDLIITGVEYKATSAGQQRFGGTSTWPQYDKE